MIVVFKMSKNMYFYRNSQCSDGIYQVIYVCVWYTFFLYVKIKMTLDVTFFPWPSWRNFQRRMVYSGLRNFSKNWQLFQSLSEVFFFFNWSSEFSIFLCFFFSIFNWRIIALQNFVVFCQTSAWISHSIPIPPPSRSSLPSCF